MGVIERQAFKRSILAYIGAVVGICSQLWIYPLAFDLYGDIQFIFAMVMFLMPFASFGIGSLTNRFYPYFEDGKKDNSFLGVLLSATLFSLLFFTITAYIFKNQYYDFLSVLGLNVQAFKEHELIIFSCSFIGVFSSILAAHCANLKRVVVPYLVGTLSWKIITPLMVLVYVFLHYSKTNVLGFISLVYIGILITLILYLVNLGSFSIVPKRSKPLLAKYKSMIYFAFYGVVASLGSLLAFQIDKIMLRGLTTSYDTGVYSSFLILAGLILYPYDSWQGINGPVVSKAWKDNDIKGLKLLNKRSSDLMLFCGVFMFLYACLNLQDFLRFSSNYEGFSKGIKAFFWLGLAKCIDSAFGINGLILGFSKYYYLGILSAFILAISNTLLNYSLIPLLGIEGAAIATFCSIVLYNVFYYMFNWVKFGIQGFSSTSLKIVVILLGAFVLAYISAVSDHFVVNILLRTIVYIGVSVYVMIRYNIVPEITMFYKKVLLRIKTRS